MYLMPWIISTVTLDILETFYLWYSLHLKAAPFSLPHWLFLNVNWSQDGGIVTCRYKGVIHDYALKETLCKNPRRSKVGCEQTEIQIYMEHFDGKGWGMALITFSKPVLCILMGSVCKTFLLIPPFPLHNEENDRQIGPGPGTTSGSMSSNQLQIFPSLSACLKLLTLRVLFRSKVAFPNPPWGHIQKKRLLHKSYQARYSLCNTFSHILSF